MEIKEIRRKIWNLERHAAECERLAAHSNDRVYRHRANYYRQLAAELARKAAKIAG